MKVNKIMNGEKNRCFGISPEGKVKVWDSYLEAGWDLHAGYGQVRPCIKLGYKLKGWAVYDFPDTIERDIEAKKAQLEKVKGLIKKYKI